LDVKATKDVEFSSSSPSYIPFCFVLGDTTVNSCCPDEVAALHLNADVLVHYGHACLSPTGTLPVIYSFGKLQIDVAAAVQKLEAAIKEKQDASTQSGNTHNKFLILYQVGYHHAMKEMQSKWLEAHGASDGDNTFTVLTGEIPAPRQKQHSPDALKRTLVSPCCQNGTILDGSSSCIAQSPNSSMGEADRLSVHAESVCCKGHVTQPEQYATELSTPRPLVIGGLELPKHVTSFDDLSDYAIIFVMDTAGENNGNCQGDSPHQRQYVNSMLCFLSLPNPPQKGYWVYSPATDSLATDVDPPPALLRQLKRRFFLTQKARDASVFGILVSNLSQQHLVDVVKSLQQIIEKANKTSYSFAVGKINPAKLANFAEIEAFCLVACREHSLLDFEREYPVPVITPMELEIALGNLEWGAQAYSLDCQDIMMRQGQQMVEKGESDDDQGDTHTVSHDEDDAPYFSLVTGGYMSKTSTGIASSTDVDLQNLPGQGQVIEYKSEAANFLKQREYKGLESQVGQTEAKSALRGLSGIASDYSGS
jgi:diphthamide biosynthesis protein 2